MNRFSSLISLQREGSVGGRQCGQQGGRSKTGDENEGLGARTGRDAHKCAWKGERKQRPCSGRCQSWWCAGKHAAAAAGVCGSGLLRGSLDAPAVSCVVAFTNVACLQPAKSYHHMLLLLLCYHKTRSYCSACRLLAQLCPTGQLPLLVRQHPLKPKAPQQPLCQESCFL